MSIRDHEFLPEWVWDLIDAIEKYEDEHPPLYRLTAGDKYEFAQCIGDAVDGIIPGEVREIAAIMRLRAARQDGAA